MEKTDKYEENGQIFSISNLCLMGTSVISGSATAIVINTGFETYLGGMGKQIDNKKELTNFQKRNGWNYQVVNKIYGNCINSSFYNICFYT